MAEPQTATFAGGCFWCMQPPYDSTDGILKTVVGYTAGEKENPTYEEVSAGQTGHTEAIQITFNPDIISYEKLLDIFWMNIDPTVKNRQFCDVGSQYRSGIYYHNDEQKAKAVASRDNLLKKFEDIATEIEPASVFYPAENYHQDYYQKNPIRYKLYRYGCGRDKRLDQLWGN